MDEQRRRSPIRAVGNHIEGYRGTVDVRVTCRHRHPTTTEAYACAREMAKLEFERPTTVQP